MPKMIIIECSDEEADRMVEQLKNMIAEYEYHPYHGPGKVYEFELLRIDQCGIKGMPDIRSQSLDHAPSQRQRVAQCQDRHSRAAANRAVTGPRAGGCSIGRGLFAARITARIVRGAHVRDVLRVAGQVARALPVENRVARHPDDDRRGVALARRPGEHVEERAAAGWC